MEVTRRAPKSARPGHPWRWVALSLALVGIGTASVFAFPYTEQVLGFGRTLVQGAPPSEPLQPERSDQAPSSGAPADSVPDTAPEVLEVAAPAATEAPSPPVAARAPGPAAAEAVPTDSAGSVAPAPGKDDASELDSVDEMLGPLVPVAKSAAPSRRTPVRKKPARKEQAELQRDWKRTRALFDQLTQVYPCESAGVSLLCARFRTLENDMGELGDSYDVATHKEMKQLRRDLQQRVKSIP